MRNFYLPQTLSKKILFIAISYFTPALTDAQVNYFNYLDHTVQYQQRYDGWNGSSGFTITTNFWFNGDTLINGHWYYKQPVSNVCVNAQPQFTAPAYVREDNNKKFYHFDFNSNSDKVDYDWNQYLALSVGSSWPNPGWTCKVAAIDSVLIGNTYRKRWIGSLGANTTPKYPYCVVEGIGALGPICSFGVEGNRVTTCYKKQSNQYTFVPDANNCAFVSTPVGLSINEKINEISVFPNPANDRIYFESLQTNARVKLYDLVGKCVLEKECSDSKSLDVSSFNKGLYILEIYSGTKLAGTRKIFIE